MGTVRWLRIRQTRETGAPERREGFGSFLYYVLIDWWLSWL
jgi:hypothetical protein